LSNQSAVENIEREQQDFDQYWAQSIRTESGTNSFPFFNCEAFNPFDDVNYLNTFYSLA